MSIVDLKSIILFEDEQLLVLNKPAILHSVSQDKGGYSLADAIIEIYPELQHIGNPGDAGLCQRLDYSTSGCILAAKTQKTWDLVAEILKAGGVTKTYQIFTEGCFDSIEVENYIGGNYRGSKKVKVHQQLPRNNKRVLSAKTSFKLLRYSSNLNISLVEASASIARRHQIRAHASYCGHPLIGDHLYGSTSSLETYFEKNSLLERDFFLHCNYLRLNNASIKLSQEIEAKHPLACNFESGNA